MQRLELTERRNQRIELFSAETLRDRLLRLRPARLRALQRGLSVPRYRYFPRARIVSTNYFDVAMVDERVEIARQRRSVEKLPFSELGDPQRPVARQRAQQRELRNTQADGRHRVVVELCQGTRRTAKPAAGAGRGGRVDDVAHPGGRWRYEHMHVTGSIGAVRTDCNRIMPACADAALLFADVSFRGNLSLKSHRFRGEASD